MFTSISFRLFLFVLFFFFISLPTLFSGSFSSVSLHSPYRPLLSLPPCLPCVRHHPSFTLFFPPSHFDVRQHPSLPLFLLHVFNVRHHSSSLLTIPHSSPYPSLTRVPPSRLQRSSPLFLAPYHSSLFPYHSPSLPTLVAFGIHGEDRRAITKTRWKREKE